MAIDTDDKMLAWLRRFGYVLQDNPTPDVIAAAVRKMQHVYGLKQDGVPGPITRRAMGLFRCSQRDANIVLADTQSTTTPVAAGTTCRWKKSNVTFSINSSFVLANDRETCTSIIRQGFKYYEPLTGLTFIETDTYDAADIQILAGASKAMGMDGPGNILALSGTPCGSKDKKLRSIFDSEEPWNLQLSGAGIIMASVWMHELGHLVGLNHSANADDLMSPYYNPSIIYPQRGDKQRMAALYGIPYVATQETETALNVGAYSLTGTLVVRHDGGVALNLRNIVARQQ